MRDDDDEQVKIELLSQWKLEAESRNLKVRRLAAALGGDAVQVNDAVNTTHYAANTF